MEGLSNAFRVLGDATRLRLLRLLSRAPLNVTELVSVVGLAQSSVSHHLAKLKTLGLVREARSAGFSYYSLAIGETDARWLLVKLAKDAPDEHGDDARLQDLLADRQDRITLNERLLEPGQSWFLWYASVARLLPPLRVADFGCGTGTFACALARWAKEVVSVDRSAAALAQARARITRAGLTNVRLLEADLSSLPLPDDDLDAVFVSQSLHHVEEPGRVLAEAGRVVKPGGRLLVLELMPHQERWVEERLGHRHLGFEPEALKPLVEDAGFTSVEWEVPPRAEGVAFRVFLLTGEKRDE